jgi:hypothetical protein
MIDRRGAEAAEYRRKNEWFFVGEDLCEPSKQFSRYSLH